MIHILIELNELRLYFKYINKIKKKTILIFRDDIVLGLITTRLNYLLIIIYYL